MAGKATPKKQTNLKPAWKPGQSGNPAGRPKGARNKLGEAFIDALYADFQDNGIEAIQKVRTEKPEAYLATLAKILPAEAVVKHDVTEAFANLWTAVSDGSIREMATGVAEKQGQSPAVRH